MSRILKIEKIPIIKNGINTSIKNIWIEIDFEIANKYPADNWPMVLEIQEPDCEIPIINPWRFEGTAFNKNIFVVVAVKIIPNVLIIDHRTIPIQSKYSLNEIKFNNGVNPTIEKKKKPILKEFNFPNNFTTEQ